MSGTLGQGVLGQLAAMRDVAEEVEVSQDSVRRWVKQAQIDSGQRKDGLTTAERKELRELRRELRRVRMERAAYDTQLRPMLG